ncbi:hypothetical protein AVDCRST_MAG82-1735 [uncultured Rubrobacteraceae bacterium]|uniref:Uncharacterized protein n=1 Tax=uncultured Rubrobacteraceae bacterium TaxID=349277 RepID=A0A6J4PTC4_9ACTN|nr:hypothetical protein AVDCRST_MAG82-1735 [uncultured Rubrobacteraceae bacterium]
MVDTESVMRYDVDMVDLPGAECAGEGDFSFAAFSLAHTACGDDVVEVRLGEDTLLEWCMACSVMEIFGPRER